MSHQNLAVFDFDWSLIEEDSDYWTIQNLSPVQWEKVKTLAGMQWTDLMDLSVKEIQDQGVTKDQFMAVLEKIPFTTAMLNTLKVLHSHHTRVLILSDANTFYIDTILRAYGVRDLVSDIITNPAYTDEKHRFRIQRHIPASDPPHQCPNSCAVNICKGQELDKYIATHGPFERVMYVGDGKNDYCPSTRLRETDRLFARSGKSLSAMLKNDPEAAAKIKSNITFWETSEVVLKAVEDEHL
ncbi:phosphatase phospho-type [Radiomyces spectabilis]|uniref:phosphatase phospho-type n=1 Tax=Radiomyces spectabilis TaxID=64574 RepID=UPI00221EF813|nr:phosphatase phospho-type [Radiomyces spectabilis]KAI8390828.1 phosphatase phospho-type [Radiomyces spectabilis]